MTSTRKKESKLTDEEMARGLFLAGYHQALDDVAELLGLSKEGGSLDALRLKAAGVQARAVINKARPATAPLL